MTTLALAKCRFKSFVQIIEQAWILPPARAGVDATMSAATPWRGRAGRRCDVCRLTRPKSAMASGSSLGDGRVAAQDPA